MVDFSVELLDTGTTEGWYPLCSAAKYCTRLEFVGQLWVWVFWGGVVDKYLGLHECPTVGSPLRLHAHVF